MKIAVAIIGSIFHRPFKFILTLDKIKTNTKMALIDTYRNTLSTKHKELAKLVDGRAKEQKRISDISGKINKAKDAIRRTKSQSTIQSKLKEIDRCEKDLATSYKKISDIETKIGKKNKEIQVAQDKVDKEVASIDKKRNSDLEKTRKLQEQR